MISYLYTIKFPINLLFCSCFYFGVGLVLGRVAGPQTPYVAEDDLELPILLSLFLKH